MKIPCTINLGTLAACILTLAHIGVLSSDNHAGFDLTPKTAIWLIITTQIAMITLLTTTTVRQLLPKPICALLLVASGYWTGHVLSIQLALIA